LTAHPAAVVDRDDVLAGIVQVFFRPRHRLALVHGETGVGTSTMAQVLAAAVRAGRFPGLGPIQVVGFDLQGMASEEYAPAAERVLAFMEREPERIYVVEGFVPYLVEKYAVVSRRLAHAEYRLLIIADSTDYAQLSAAGKVLDAFVESLEVPEPNEELTSQIVRTHGERLAAEYGVDFLEGTFGAAIRQTRDYLMGQRFPAKAVDLLAAAAADVAALAEMNTSPERRIGPADLARRLAAVTGIPEETILGTGDERDYGDLLSERVLGQDAAVAKVAQRLDLIHKGMVDRSAPAAVFVFTGLPGTGKNELAKQVAQLYSNSHSLIHFEMGNFTQSHSVSALLGSAPGLVGYDEGGPLINALNRDPYSVVLLDEAEKAHPTIWDPFLHLFDEGTISDARGVTASGTRAFFVMTSNVGQYEIADMLAAGASLARIEETVLQVMTEVMHPTAHQPCFRPELISRIQRSGGIVTFDALSERALAGIARHMIGRLASDYAAVHSGRFVCDDAVVAMMARTAYEANAETIRARRPGYLGARPLASLVNQHVTSPLADALREVAGAPLVRAILSGGTTRIVAVTSEGDAEALLAEQRSKAERRVTERLEAIRGVGAPDVAGVDDAALARLDRLLAQVVGTL
jgi:ATP-dependent Clp protease ATP-binding subunit ClpA